MSGMWEVYLWRVTGKNIRIKNSGNSHKIDISVQLKKIVISYQKIGYNMAILRLIACMVVNSIMVDNFVFLLHDGGLVVRLNDGSLLNLFQMASV